MVFSEGLLQDRKDVIFKQHHRGFPISSREGINEFPGVRNNVDALAQQRAHIEPVPYVHLVYDDPYLRAGELRVAILDLVRVSLEPGEANRIALTDQENPVGQRGSSGRVGIYDRAAVNHHAIALVPAHRRPDDFLEDPEHGLGPDPGGLVKLWSRFRDRCRNKEEASRLGSVTPNHRGGVYCLDIGRVSRRDVVVERLAGNRDFPRDPSRHARHIHLGVYEEYVRRAGREGDQLGESAGDGRPAYTSLAPAEGRHRNPLLAIRYT